MLCLCKSVVRRWKYAPHHPMHRLVCVVWLQMQSDITKVRTLQLVSCVFVTVCFSCKSELCCTKDISYHSSEQCVCVCVRTHLCVCVCTLFTVSSFPPRGIIHPVKWWGGKCHYVEIADAQLDLQGLRCVSECVSACKKMEIGKSTGPETVNFIL